MFLWDTDLALVALLMSIAILGLEDSRKVPLCLFCFCDFLGMWMWPKAANVLSKQSRM